MGPPPAADVETPYAWFRLALSLLVSTIGGIGMWSVVVILPDVEAEFGISRGEASLPYLALMIGFAAGGIVMGRLCDRLGIVPPLLLGAVSLAVGYVAASQSETLWQFVIAHGLLIGLLGSSATFGPILADISRWFTAHRGTAVAVCACGTYLAGAIWPPLVQYGVGVLGWRGAYLVIAAVCLATLVPLAFLFKPVPPRSAGADLMAQDGQRIAARGLQRTRLQVLLTAAGLCCCIAMSMPQVHIVALCADLGYGSASGSQLLSVMLATGTISRLVFGWVADRFGPLRTLLISSILQAISLLLFLLSDSLASLYLVSFVFGLSQGGLVPTYATCVRKYFPANEAGSRIGIVFSATLGGMAVGGWMSGALYDLTLSYDAAFINGFAWNLINIGIAVYLLIRLEGSSVWARAARSAQAR